MFKVMIVDDEEDIRGGLAAIVDWAEHGFQVAAEAANGKEALEALEREPIHFVITDISMPVLSGLDLIRTMRERRMQQPVVILSGYNDFEYLKEALKYRVDNYLLKPVDEEELLSTLKQVCDELRHAFEYNIREKENIGILRGKILNRLVTNHITKLEFMQKAEFLQIDLDAPAYRVLVIELENATKRYDRTGERFDHLKLYSAMNICEEVLRAHADGILFEDALQRLVFIEKLSPSGDGVSYREVAATLKEALKRYIREPASVIVGPKAQGIADIHRSYERALQLLEYKFYLGREATITEADVPSADLPTELQVDALAERMVQAIQAGDAAVCRGVTTELFERLKACAAALGQSFVHQTTFELLKSALQVVKDAGGRVRDIVPHPERLYGEILSMRTIDEVRSFLDSTLDDILGSVSALKRERPAKVVMSVLDYMKAHYNEELTLKQVAELHYMSSGYLGKLFKKETGFSFHDYLNRIRIDKAKELLKKTNHFAYQVSGLVGYKDYNYFHKTFKKYAGVPPSEYH
ncbi:response regulator transcription factor [Paenibacillus sp.]|uniref:response regulator transcription factor n=1 Tax=Paenibacillus sp. TaxID=58172 RepID=UPI002D4B5A88|nr:response regulator transcription factor [Paenibacillus sp.]HZG87186.1 response regulator transcription factor [Paenibacillus sp.]